MAKSKKSKRVASKKGAVRYATVSTWARELGVASSTVAKKLKSSEMKGSKARSKNGQLCDFFPEPAVRAACADLLKALPQADEGNSFVINGIRHSTLSACSLQQGVSENAIMGRIRDAKMAPVHGKSKSGHVSDFYSESAVRELCADLLKDLPQMDKDGFVYLDK